MKTNAAFCEICDDLVIWVECPTGGWWKHLDHPTDGHDAEAPSPQMCDGCEYVLASHSLAITDSESNDRVSVSCWPCLESVLKDWAEYGEFSDIKSWIVERL